MKSKEFERFDKAMEHLLTVSYKDLKQKLEEEKQEKIGTRGKSGSQKPKRQMKAKR